MDDLISRAAATRAAVISVRDYLGNIDSERDIHIEEGLHEVPAVDAIPVEWLHKKIKEHTDDEGWQDYLANSFGLCIEEWQKEQVAKT